MPQFHPTTLSEVELPAPSTEYDRVLREVFLTGSAKTRAQAALDIDLDEGETTRGVNARVRHAARRIGLAIQIHTITERKLVVTLDENRDAEVE